MADGTEKQIKDVRVGDRVQATDPQTGKSKPELVQRVIVGKDLKHLVDVSVPSETVEATYNHPFWVAEDREFEWATDLKVGKHVLLASGKTLPVVGLARHDEITTVYNLSIQQIHTFFVGDEPVLVHNSCFTSPDPHVADLANAIEARHPGQLEGVNMTIEGQEYDIVTKNAFIEVKKGNGAGLTRQIRNRLNPDRPLIGCAPRLGPHTARSIDEAGGIAAGGSASDLSTLLDILRP